MSIKQGFSGYVDVEQRVWLRLKWVRQYAAIDPSGFLRISTSSVHEKLQYNLTGARAVLCDADVWSNSKGQLPTIQIRLDPTKQEDGSTVVNFRLPSTSDIGPWLQALSR